MIEVAVEHAKPVRIGVNWGSLDRALLTELMDANARRPDPLPDREVMLEAITESALRSADLAEVTGQPRDRIVLSAKVSGVRDLIDVYRQLAARCVYPLHLGSPRRDWDPRESSPPPRPSRCCSSRASATRSAVA